MSESPVEIKFPDCSSEILNDKIIKNEENDGQPALTK